MICSPLFSIFNYYVVSELEKVQIKKEKICTLIISIKYQL